MLKYGIICEFNPFHNGHKYLIEQTRKQTHADAVICIMSGSMVQRGDVAIFDKWTRAKAAVQNGADLVIELPVCYVLQSADNFALGAVEILNGLNADGISFGSEYADEELLKRIAEIKKSEPEEYKKAFKTEMEAGRGYPSACESAVRACIDGLPDGVFMPNATLAISYICAAMKVNPCLKFNTVKRIGNYHSTELAGEFPSASAIRRKILENDCLDGFCEYGKSDIYRIENISSLILGFFRLKSSSELACVSGMESGLANRMVNAAKNTTSFEDFVSECVTKRYTAHRIRRCILCALLGIEKIEKPTYARVLALNKTGAQVLKDAAKNGPLKIITKTADFKYLPGSMFEKDILATDIQALCANKKASADFVTAPYIDRKE